MCSVGGRRLSALLGADFSGAIDCPFAALAGAAASACELRAVPLPLASGAMLLPEPFVAAPRAGAMLLPLLPAGAIGAGIDLAGGAALRRAPLSAAFTLVAAAGLMLALFLRWKPEAARPVAEPERELATAA